MPIRILPLPVSEKIAAGEVIERPGSIVRELVDNSVDAGATAISVNLLQGGKSLIEVIDNGQGIPGDELALAMQRHATSKIQTFEDLDRIQSLGFRGEALPSMVAVAQVSVLSRTAGAKTAFEYANGQTKAVTFGHFLSSAHGTRVRVENLFTDIPVRLKFLKSSGAELAFVREHLEKMAVAYPQIAFTLSSDDRAILNLPPTLREDRIKKILGDSNPFTLRSHKSEISDLKIQSYWLEGVQVPNSRKLLTYLNNRYLKDKLLQQACHHVFKQFLLPGQNPALAIFFEMNPSEFDVNVHPTKQEVRFLKPSDIFSAVRSHLEILMGDRGERSVRELQGLNTSQPHFEARRPWLVAEDNPQQPWVEILSQAGNERRPEHVTPAPESMTSLSPPALAHPVGKFLGIFQCTYLMFEKTDPFPTLAFLDQHAAHERIRFEKLSQAVSARQTIEHQKLLFPETITFEDAHELKILEPTLHWFEEMGFETEIFGEKSLVFRSIPALFGNFQLTQRLYGLTRRVLDVAMNFPDQIQKALGEIDGFLFEKLAMEACRSAIKAGDRIDEVEAKNLVFELFQCKNPWNCPHGRPTWIYLPETKIEEWFQRRLHQPSPETLSHGF